MKTISIPCYHHNSFVATHALGLMMNGYTFVVSMNQKCSQQSRSVEAQAVTEKAVSIWKCFMEVLIYPNHQDLV